jgi:hypothetical protein
LLKRRDWLAKPSMYRAVLELAWLPVKVLLTRNGPRSQDGGRK